MLLFSMVSIWKLCILKGWSENPAWKSGLLGDFSTTETVIVKIFLFVKFF